VFAALEEKKSAVIHEMVKRSRNRRNGSQERGPGDKQGKKSKEVKGDPWGEGKARGKKGGGP